MHRPQNWRQWALILLGSTGAIFLLVLPLVLIFARALSGGWSMLFDALGESDMRAAIALTVTVAVITVPVNVIFGVLMAWCVTRYDFHGRKILVTLIDIPYATSPVVAGLCYLVIYGLESAMGAWFNANGMQLMFAWPGIVMVTIFVTSPFVARILIPLMQAQGTEEEHAALTLGANGWQIFRRVTLPNIKWGLLYGTVITNARAVGEFGAVSVVSGAIRGKTVTLPLLIEQLNDDYKTVGAFTAAALLACMALLTLVIKTAMEWRSRSSEAEAVMPVAASPATLPRSEVGPASQ